jgi:hypothetical protein
MVAGGRHGCRTLVMSTVNMAWPAGIGKTALPEGRGLARSRSKGQSSDEILASTWSLLGVGKYTRAREFFLLGQATSAW